MPPSDMCHDVTVNTDLDQPTATVNLSSILTATDNDRVASITPYLNGLCNPSDPLKCWLSIGTTSVLFVVKDPSGNEAACAAQVTVVDNQAPSIADCPTAPVTVDTLSNQNYAIPALPAITASDNSQLAVTLSGVPNPAAQFVFGTTPVVIIATDFAGNAATCNFDVVVSGLSWCISLHLACDWPCRPAAADPDVPLDDGQHGRE